MATKAQRAERDAEHAAPDHAAPDHVALVAMTKGGETLDVHPTCVSAHKQAGWKVKD
jgi:hypothetical protein